MGIQYSKFLPKHFSIYVETKKKKQKRMKRGSGASGVCPVRLISNDGVIGGKSGRLEVFVNGVWGTVCNDYSTENDPYDRDQHDDSVALVVCRMLGLSGGRTIF